MILNLLEVVCDQGLCTETVWTLDGSLETLFARAARFGWQLDRRHLCTKHRKPAACSACGAPKPYPPIPDGTGGFLCQSCAAAKST